MLRVVTNLTITASGICSDWLVNISEDSRLIER